MQTYIEFAAVPSLYIGRVAHKEEAWSRGLPIFVKDMLPPPVGSIVRANFNSIGLCRVVGYFAESSSKTEPQFFFGLHVLPLDPPAWFVKQNGPGAKCHLFGPEFEVVTLADPAEEAARKSECSDCGALVAEVIGCPDGAEVCRDCFDGH